MTTDNPTTTPATPATVDTSTTQPSQTKTATIQSAKIEPNQVQSAKVEAGAVTTPNQGTTQPKTQPNQIPDNAVLQDTVGDKPHNVTMKEFQYLDQSPSGGDGSPKNIMRTYRLKRANNLHLSMIAKIVVFGGMQALADSNVDISVFYQPAPDNANDLAIYEDQKATALASLNSSMAMIVGQLLITNEETMIELAANCLKKGDGSNVTYAEMIDGDLFPMDSALDILVSWFETVDVVAFLPKLLGHISRLWSVVELSLNKVAADNETHTT